jgi:FKBP-type peptidyl-prolyl cis-trans isomerase FklB
MKRILICALAFLALTVHAQSKKELQEQVSQLQGKVNQLNAQIEELKKPASPKIKTTTDSASYGIGILLGSNVKRQVGDTMNIAVLIGGLRDVFDGKPLQVTEPQASMIIQQCMQVSMEKKARVIREESKTFLEENKKKPGVVTTASGLQYQVLTKGTGKAPAATSSVTVHYTGKLVDGTVFDSSVSRGEPATFALNQVITGWTEALQLMHEGDKWLVFLPSDLGYGERGSGPQIPPNAALIFEIELLKVN